MTTRNWAPPVQIGLIALGMGILVLPLAFPLVDWEPNEPAGFLIPAALLGGTGLAGIFIGTRVTQWQNRAAYPSCGGCGYKLTGNMSGICPECGAPAHSTIDRTRRTGLKLGCLSLFSGALGVILLSACIWSHGYRPPDGELNFGPWIRVTGDVRVGIQCFRARFAVPPYPAELWVTHGDHPYRGSIITISDGNGRTYPPTTVIGFNFPFYFRHIAQAGMIWWTARIPIPFLLTLLGIAPGLWILKRLVSSRGGGKAAQNVTELLGRDPLADTGGTPVPHHLHINRRTRTRS